MKKIRYPLPWPCPKMRTIEGLVIHLSSLNVYQFGSTSYFLMRFSAVVSSLPSLYMQIIHKFIEMCFGLKKIRYPLPRPCPKMRAIDGLVIHLPSSNVYQFGSTSYFLMRFSAVVSLLPSLYMQSIHKFIEMCFG